MTDHLHYAITRAKENIQLPNPLLFETKNFIRKRISSSERGSFVRETKDGWELSEDEAGFIAFHFVNSQQGNEDMQVTMTATTMVKRYTEYHQQILRHRVR